MTLDVLPEVAAALAAGGPVVALETTLICHGIPRPRNRALAFELERAVREGGAVPATIAVIDGRVRVGLSEAELDALAGRDDVEKASTRDLSWLMAAGRTGATTVASTIFLAARAGIRIMATGGLGGVHRGGEASLDISADLHELARCRIGVVCSGAKSILDLPRTLEVLESLGVPILGLGVDRLPGFYTGDSGLAIPRLRGSAEAAAVLRAQAELGWPASVVIANPPPIALALGQAEVERLVEAAIAEARRQGVRGKDETPFMLAHMANATDGHTVALNESLVLANARAAAAIAAAVFSTSDLNTL